MLTLLLFIAISFVEKPPTSREHLVEQLLCLASNYRQVEKSVMLLNGQEEIIAQIPCIAPLCTENLLHIHVSSGYGGRLHPILNEYKHHSGIDLPGSYGEKVYTPADGQILIAASTNSPIGTFIKIGHRYGFITTYGHLSRLWVQQGDKVKLGQIIGEVGNSGRSTGPHLHYSITKNGVEQNPLPYCYLYLEWKKMLSCEGKKLNQQQAKFTAQQ